MAFHKPRSRNYLKRLSVGFFQFPDSQVRPASSLPSIRISLVEGAAEEEAARDFQLQKQQIEAELEAISTETLTLTRRHSSSKYRAVTVPLSVKHQVTETRSAMARPRSPPRKNDVDHDYLQGLLDDELLVIRQQLNSLSSERTKMEQKMEDLTNGIKEALELSACLPKRIIVTSTPGSIRRARSMEPRKPHLIKSDSQQSFQKRPPPPLEEVDGMANQQFRRERYTSMSSVGSSNEQSDINSLSESVNLSSVFSSSVPTISFGHRYSRMASGSDYLESHLSPAPIPELPESPNLPRSASPHIFATHSPLARPRSNSTFSGVKPNSPKHLHMSPQPPPSHLSLAHTLLSPSEKSRPRSGSFSLLASPRFSLKTTKSSQDLRNRSNSSPSHKRKSPGPKLRHAHKDQQLSYFRKNSLTDIESSLKDSQLSINTDDDECELKGSSEELSQLSSGTADQDLVVPAKKNSRILRRSSLTGQIEHVTNLKAHVRRNNSFNNTLCIDKSKHVSLKERHSLTADKRSDSSRRVVFLESKETTV